MKIVAIIGSPRRKNTYNMTKLLEESIKRNYSGDLEFKDIFLRDYNLDYCRGCFLCTKVGEEKCPHSAIAQELFFEMISADGVIFSSPVYVDNVTGLMKNFIDHFSYLVHRPCFFDKSAIVLSTTQGSGVNRTVDYLDETFRKWGFNINGKIGIKMPMFENNKNVQSKILNKMDRLSKKIISSILDKKKGSPSLKDLISFRIMRVMLRNIENISPKDKQYWSDRGWLDKRYYFDSRINPLTNFIASIFEYIIGNKITNKNL